MDNEIITNLNKFIKPDKQFIEDKECLICLESIDIESSQIVKLPCQCKYSVYHIICIIKLLHSGENKNFCPHCKTKYIIPINPNLINPTLINPTPINSNQVNPLQYYEYIVINRNMEQINEIYTLKIISFSHIILFHVIMNSVMNIINLLISRNYRDYYLIDLYQVLALFYLCKIFFNFCCSIYSKNNIEKIETCLICSYVYQIILIIVLIYLLTKIKYDYNCTILIINNILFNFGDLAFRIITEYKLTNRINILQ
jgi:hypothetical protein